MAKQNNTIKEQILVEELRIQQALARLWKSEDFQIALLPKLSQENKWIDPQKFDSDALFQRAYNVNWAKAQIAIEIITLLSGAEDRIVEINKRISGTELKNNDRSR